MSSVIISSKNGKFLRSPSGDLLRLSMLGGVIHVPNRGVMVHGTSEKVFLWFPETDNDVAQAIRDEVSQALAPTSAS